MSINTIVTPLDSAVLETKEQYKVYFKIVVHALKELVARVKEENICTNAEATFVAQYAELLTYSLEALRIKYLFDAEEKMRIDLTRSGLPSFLEFRYLYNDLELQQEHMNKLPEVPKLKSEFLDTLLKEKRPITDRRLHQAASVIYYTTVEKKFIYKRFVQGKIIPVLGSHAEYMISWSFYDVVHNRPFICFMYFNLHKEDVEEVRGQIYSVLENVADRNMDVDMMAYAIDKKLDYLRPKRIKKLDLGPLHSVFAKDELAVTHVILKAIVEKTFDLSAYAISLHVEEAVATAEFKEGGFFSKQTLQVWEKAEPQSYLFAPHRVIQALYDNIPETVNALTRDPIETLSIKLD